MKSRLIAVMIAVIIVAAWALEAKAGDSMSAVHEFHAGVIARGAMNAHKASVGISEKLVYDTGYVSPVLDIGAERTVEGLKNNPTDVINWMAYATVGGRVHITDSVDLYGSVGHGITSTDHSDANEAIVWKVSAHYRRFAAGYMHAAADEGNTSVLFAGVTF